MYLIKEQSFLVDGKRRHVHLMKTDRPSFFVCEVDGKKYGVELTSKLDPNDSTFSVKVDGKQYKIRLDQNKREQVTVQVDGKSFSIKQETVLQKSVKEELLPTLAKDETLIKLPLEKGAIIASMPGKVVSVKVKKEDKVEAGNVVCILEAMKMENEVLAPKTGIVQEVNVSEGMSVMKGQVLLVIKLT